MALTLQELLTHFHVDRRNGASSYQCKCPTHIDKKASLTISEKNGKLLLHCHAGCKTADILLEVGLTWEDLGNYKPPKWKEKLEFAQGKPIEAVYDYHSSDGKYLYSKVRFEGKELRYLTIDRQSDTYQYCKKGDGATLYHLPELLRAVREGYPVYIVEGEKDADTLKKLGYTATTAGGVNDWKQEYAGYFTGAKVVLLPDNDKPGLELKDRILRDLKHFAHSIRWTLTSEAEHGDVTDFLTKEGHTKEELQDKIQQAPNIGAPWIYLEERSGKPKINGDILADSISRGLSYLIVRRPEEDKDDFLVYEHGVYNRCNRNKVKSIIRRYVPVGMASDNMINNVYHLLLCNEKRICTYQDLDTSEQFINVRNGLYNIQTRKLEPHTPKLYSTIQFACEYHPEHTYRPVFTKYMNDLCQNRDGSVDPGKMAVIQEYTGLIVSNVRVSRAKLCLALYSLLGNSGKTQLLNLLGNFLGTDKVANIPIQQMNERSKFSLGGLLGKRLISIGDQTGSDITDSALFKQLTGGDVISIEQKNRQPFPFIFQGGMIFACNNLPNFTDDKGGHVFERMVVVPCTNTIEQERRDGQILDKMLKERDAIFNWFLEGLHRLIQNQFKVTKSKACEETMQEYRNRMDTVYRYLDEYFIITGTWADMISKPKFEEEYISWCLKEGFNHVGKQNIKLRMEANGCPADKANMDGKRGVMVYRNVKYKEEQFHRVTEEEYGQEELSFR